MLRLILIVTAALGGIVAILLANRPSAEPALPLVAGLRNKVLFLTDSHHGLSNVHLATASALLENHPSIELHYASFPSLAADIARITETAKANNPQAQTIHWHELDGLSLVDEMMKGFGPFSALVGPPGLAGLGGLTKAVQFLMAPWPNDAHLSLYRQTQDLIQHVDPSVVILDSMFRPAIDAAKDLNRVRAYISPNPLSDLSGPLQPKGAYFWQYPAVSSGFTYPVPWHNIPSNLYQQVRMAATMLFSRRFREKRAHLREGGIKNPVTLFELQESQVPWITMGFPEADLPLDYIPDNMHVAGPIVLDIAPAETQDPELARWLRRAPTVLIALGSGLPYDEQMARTMVSSLVHVLEATEVQVLWKMRKYGDYDDEFLKSAKTYLENSRLRIVTWLNVEPMSLYETGDIVLSVNHGGANCFYEAVRAGVPQVILPLWADLYKFAIQSEHLGIGIWPGKETAPIWESTILADGFMKALTGESSVAMRMKAKALGEKARTYGGRNTSASIIAKMAEEGII